MIADVVYRPAGLTHAILVTLLLAPLAMDKPRSAHMCCFDECTKEGTAIATVKKLAFEALPSWQAAFAQTGCPARFDDLLQFMNNKDLRDPWGTDYTLLCWTGPTGTHATVVSAGPDGVLYTADDIGVTR